MESRDTTSGSTGQLSSGGSVGGGMHHSLSTPAGVDGGVRTPPATPKKGGKMLAIRVQMLDDMVTIFQVQAKALGQVLFDQVCKQLHLLEADYFGLEYQDASDASNTRYWLDLQKPISRQLGLSLVDPLLQFCVKFYTPDPGQLEEEYTRYLFCLQVKRDLSQGLLYCNDNTAALMASYIVQAECGDYVAEDYPDHTYLSSYKFVPHQDQEMERRIMENHKKHAGQSPAEADLNLLETARRCELYGIKLHPAKDMDNIPWNLAVTHMGIVVYQNITKQNTFSWAKIRKLSFKRKKFLIKFHADGYFSKDAVEFFFEGRNECKNFWKKCVENHGFFRCSSVKHVSRHKTRVLSRGSSFRYSGRTQKQIVEFVRDNYVKRQTFQRSASFRHTSAHSSANNMHTSSVGNSISAHPLLPLADSNLSVEVSKLSASLGAMEAAASATAPTSATTKSVCLPRGTPTSWSSAPDTRPSTLPPVRTTSSPSPPQTTQSASPATSAATSPQRTSPYEKRPPTTTTSSSSPVAVRVAVHREDTGTATTNSNNNSNIIIITTSRTAACNCPPSQTQSQNDLDSGVGAASSRPDETLFFLPKRHIWQRSASCRDLYDFSFEDSGQAKRRVKTDTQLLYIDERKLESPVTRYDDHRAIYANSHNPSLEIHPDISVPDQKVYSSSYPGTTTYSQESVEDPGNYELRDSQDDLSHDSYDLIERSDDEYSTSGDSKYAKINKSGNSRSCSLDSGHYVASDTDSEHEKRHKVSKSSDDLHQDVFLMDDPRDFPREIIPRKSDGTFYKNLKPGSRTSSQESKSEYYEPKSLRASKESLRKPKRISSRTSSQESKSDYEVKRSRRKSNGSVGSVKKVSYDSRTSSQESKSEYYDAPTDPKKHDYDRKIPFERNYGTQKTRNDNSEINMNFKEVSHVHSISLQNVETEQNIRANRLSQFEQNTVPRAQKPQKYADQEPKRSVTHIWPEDIAGVPTQIEDWTTKQQSTKSTESESNIFSFDEDRIKSLEESDDPLYSTVADAKEPKKNYRDVFVEIEPRKLDIKDSALHQPIERTKSDPNNLAWQRLNSNSRRMLLKHQKSIDLTPAESSDEDYLYKQIPSAPPIMKYRETQFEMPTAEFGHFDILKRDMEGEKTKFEVPKRQFEVLGAKTQSDFINLPPKSDADIPYVLHKRHVMNGTSNEPAVDVRRVPDVEDIKRKKPKSPKSPIEPDSPSSFLFTQNIDLSKVDPVTLEIDKTAKPVQHLSSPKRDITRIDPALLETLNSKLSQIESDSPTSSRTESLKFQHKIKALQQIDEKPPIEAPKPKILPEKPLDRIKTDIKPKRVIKPRMQPGKKGKGNKNKVRITSFSSDDESLDSDDVFGSAEATPTKLEFSPPQMRKEMESILKFESERKYLQYTMSSTEVEGSPPTTRKTDTLFDRANDPNYQSELRRISERSLSIPSSEDDFNLRPGELPPVFEPDIEDITLTLETVDEVEREVDKSVEDTVDQITVLLKEQELDLQKELEKAQLNEDIENDIRELQVPAKTKITEICSPNSRRKGNGQMLFASARLNLSEGSAFTLLQKQQALESPIAGRRAKSLDTPVVPVNRLPPLNSFSSKDDTVEEEDEPFMDPDNVRKPQEIKSDDEKVLKEIKEEVLKDSESQKKPQIAKTEEKPKIEHPKPKLMSKQKSIEKDQIVPDLSKKKPVPRAPTKAQVKPTVKTKTTVTPPKPISKDPKKLAQKLPPKQITSKVKTAAKSDKPQPPKSLSLMDKSETAKPPLQTSLQLPEIKRTKSPELDPSKKSSAKEKNKPLEKLEFKRTSSKERTKSQEESEVDSAKRQEYQQMLYETAIKQTKTVKSPVKDIMPVFPQVEEMVRERGGKLEISINTIENSAVNLEEAIIITKSPKKLDKKLMDQKLTKSLEITLSENEEKSVQRLGKSLDIENRIPTPEHLEFDFKTETIESMKQNESPDSPQVVQPKEIVEADVHNAEALDTDTEETLQDTESSQLILEGTSLDVWISVDDKKGNDNEKLKDIEILEKSSTFFEDINDTKPPDLDTPQIEDVEQPEIFFQDADPAELKEATKTVERLLLKKLQNRRLPMKLPVEAPEESLETPDQTLVRITSEDESLTSVSEIKIENQDSNYLGVSMDHKDALHRLSIERSRSEDTGSWMTVECDEYVGADSFEYDNVEHITEESKSPIKIATPEPVIDTSLLTTQNKKIEMLKRSSDQSRSSDTTGSWTSGEKDLSPGKTGDESSVSCSIGRAFGLSQTIEKFSSKDQLAEKSSPEDVPRSPRSPRICVLGRTFTIDEDPNLFIRIKSDSDSPPNDEHKALNAAAIKKPYPFEEKWSNDSELSQRLQKRIAKKLLTGEKNGSSSIEDSISERRKNGLGSSLEKPSLNSVDRLSAESRNSVDTESSSGSFGLNNRGGSTEMSCTWKRFPLESGSASSSIEDVADHELYAQEYFLSREGAIDLPQDVYKLDPDATPTKESIEAADNLDKYNYPLGGYPPDPLSNFTTNFLTRTLSRISERSSNSEKTSVEDESTKASTHSDSLNEGSLSSDPPSLAQGSESKKQISKPSEKFEYPDPNHLLQRQISDDRRTSAEMAELSIDDIEILTSERGLKLRRQDSDDTIIDEEDVGSKKDKSSSSQDSEEWPLPEIPSQRILMALHETPSSDYSQPTTQLFQPPVRSEIPKVFGLQGSLQSQSSELWPSPPSSLAEPNLVVGKIETHYITPPEEACKVMVESTTTGSYENESNSLSDKTLEYEVEDNENENDDDDEKTHTYENVATDQISESISESLSAGPSGVKIVLEPKSVGSNSNSEELNVSNLNDDVFMELADSRNELRPPTVMRKSTSDESSHSSKKERAKSKSKSSHSSYSEDDPTSSLGTTLEDGTVRYALKPTKCTHSSHSEDTSIALSLSEWSTNSTTTVKFQTLSTSNSGKSSGLKSDDNSLTDLAHSISEWSSSNSNTLKAQSFQFQKLSSSTGDSSTLTEKIPPISDWPSSADAKSLNSQSFFSDRSLSRLGSSVEEPESLQSPLPLQSPLSSMSRQSLNATEDIVNRFGIKSNERPMIIPVNILSDEKSTESSSMEQRTVHTQRYDKQKYQKHQSIRSTSVDRPVKVPLKLSKCSPYYSSSLSSESTPMTVAHPLPMSKTATIPLTRTHKKSSSLGKVLFTPRSPPSENDSTSSMESAKCRSEPRDRRGYRRRRHTPQKRHKVDRDPGHFSKDDYFYADRETSQFNEYIRNRSLEELACGYHYENTVERENVEEEEGYYPDGDSQSGSDIFRMERDEADEPEGFDVSSIPPPLIEDDFEVERGEQI